MTGLLTTYWRGLSRIKVYRACLVAFTSEDSEFSVFTAYDDGQLELVFDRSGIPSGVTLTPGEQTVSLVS